MRTVTAWAFVLGAALSGCATTSSSTTKGAPVNVALVRHEIGDTLHDRAIVSMGHVEQGRAIVFTKGNDNARHQETWVRDGNGAWTMSATTVVAGN